MLEAKKTKDIYKDMIKEQNKNIDSALLNLSDSVVNSLVNFGSNNESLFSDKELYWITKVKDLGIMTAVGLLGFVYYQNFEEFSSLISDYFDLKDGYAKAGACIALGLTTSGVVDENDPTFALLTECIESQDYYTKMGACIGLGISYANMRKNELKEMLPSIINDENLPLEVSVNASIALSLSFI